MKQLNHIILFLSLFFMVISCDKNEDDTDIEINPDTQIDETDTETSTNISEEENTMYFPFTNSEEWETTEVSTLNWNENNLESLYTHLEDNDTRAFIILKDGKIVVEKYFGKNILETKDFDKDTNWYWASAGKTIFSFMVGIAQQEGYLDINDKTSNYLGKNWTSLTEEQEELITLKHQLTMTTGLDYDVDNVSCTDSNCLTYSTNAGDEWYYYDAPYLLVREVLNEATGKDYAAYTKEKLEDKIGMSSPNWFSLGEDAQKIYWSNARDMARFGLLILNEGVWNDEVILSDTNYFTEMTTTSQDINDAYGYFWWLNGKDSIIFPSTTETINIELASNAPDDLIAAIGKNGQFIDVIPSENLVIIRMGKAPNDNLVPTVFHNEMWELINDVIN